MRSQEKPLRGFNQFGGGKDLFRGKREEAGMFGPLNKGKIPDNQRNRQSPGKSIKG